MPQKSNLRLNQVPSAFIAMGEKHNAIVDLLRTMTGTGMCSVVFSEGKIIISVPTVSTTGGSITVPDPLTIGTINVTNLNATNESVSYLNATSATFGSLYSPNITATTVTATQFFGNLSGTTVTATTVTATNYFGTNVNVTTVTATNGTVTNLQSTTVTVSSELNSPSIRSNNSSLTSSGLVISTGTYSASILLSALNRNMAIKEIDVCSSGVAKKMLILASDPY